jgi:molybdopterin-guanine dinucleotide biosynthesis protein A
LRMGGVDKGLQLFQSRPLVQHALERLARQTDGKKACGVNQIIINANRNLDVYRAACQPRGDGAGPADIQVVSDHDESFSGPLAGFQAGLAVCRTPLMLTVPCDSPIFPLDLAHRLWVALAQADADMAVVAAPETGRDGRAVLRSQPVFCLMRITVADSLRVFLDSGGRKVDAWTDSLRRVEVAFDTVRDEPHAFTNANTLDELRLLEKL